MDFLSIWVINSSVKWKQAFLCQYCCINCFQGCRVYLQLWGHVFCIFAGDLELLATQDASNRYSWQDVTQLQYMQSLAFHLFLVLNEDSCTKLSSLCYFTYLIPYSYYIVTMLCRAYAALRTLSLNAKYQIWVNWTWFHMLSHSQVTCIELLIIICVQQWGAFARSWERFLVFLPTHALDLLPLCWGHCPHPLWLSLNRLLSTLSSEQVWSESSNNTAAPIKRLM